MDDKSLFLPFISGFYHVENHTIIPVLLSTISFLILEYKFQTSKLLECFSTILVWDEM